MLTAKYFSPIITGKAFNMANSWNGILESYSQKILVGVTMQFFLDKKYISKSLKCLIH